MKFKNLLFLTYIDTMQSSRMRYGDHLVFVGNTRNTNTILNVIWKKQDGITGRMTNVAAWLSIGSSGDCLLERIWVFLVHKRLEISPAA